MSNLVVFSAAGLVFGLLVMLVPARLALGLGVSVLVAAVVLYPSVFAPGTSSIPAALIGVAAVVLASSRRSRGSHPPPASLWPVALTLFYVLVLVLMTWGGGRLPSPPELMVPILSVVAVSAAQRMTPLDLRIVGATLLLLGAAELVVALFEIGGALRPIWGVAEGDIVGSRPNPFFGNTIDRAQGTVGHPTLLAVLFVFCMIVVLEMTGRQRLAVRLLAVAPAALGIVLSGTRTAVLVAAVILLWRLLADPRSLSRFTTTFVIGSFASLVLLVFGSTILGYLGGIAEEASDSGSFSHRAAGIEAIGPLLAQDPLTVLLGSGQDISSLFGRGLLQQDGFDVVDNQFITTLATTGVIGLLLLVTTILIALTSAGRLGRTLVAASVMMFFSIDFIHVLTDSVVLFYGAIGISTNPVLSRARRLPVATDRAPSRVSRRSLAVRSPEGPRRGDSYGAAPTSPRGRHSL